MSVINDIVISLISVKITATALRNHITSEDLNDGVKQCLDTGCGLWWSGINGMLTLQEASCGADAGAMEGGSSIMSYITSGMGGQYPTDLGADLSSFVQVCFEWP